MITVVDQIGQRISIAKVPQRIVSLVPSQTELLVDLGLFDPIKGVTKFCVHPKELRRLKTVVGGTKQVSIDKIKDLQPDIILCNKEENTQEMVRKLKEIAPVHVSNVTTIKDTLELIEQYGKLFDVKAIAQDLMTKIEARKNKFLITRQIGPLKSCLYLIWKKPYMAAGNNTFINHLLALNGFDNSCKSDRYPEIGTSQMQEVDYILLSSEPYPFSEKHIQELKSETNGRIILVDGEYFSWYGSRLLKAFDYFEKFKTQL